MKKALAAALAASLATGATAAATSPRDLTAPGPQGALAGTLIPPAEGGPLVLIVPGSGPTDRDETVAGIPIFGYHFMPSRVWRTSTTTPARGGAQATAFDMELVKNAPLTHGRVFTADEMWTNYEYFIKALLPVAEAVAAPARRDLRVRKNQDVAVRCVVGDADNLGVVDQFVPHESTVVSHFHAAGLTHERAVPLTRLRVRSTSSATPC